MNKFETFTFNCLSVFASAIQYGDESALTELESEIINEWLDKLFAEYPGAVLSIGSDVDEFALCDVVGLHGTLVPVTVTYPIRD